MAYGRDEIEAAMDQALANLELLVLADPADWNDFGDKLIAAGMTTDLVVAQTVTLLLQVINTLATDVAIRHDPDGWKTNDTMNQILRDIISEISSETTIDVVSRRVDPGAQTP